MFRSEFEKSIFRLFASGIISNVLYAQNVNHEKTWCSQGQTAYSYPSSTNSAPAPKPLNPNIEFRGMFFYGNEWYFSLHDRQKNKGAWLKIGESFDGGMD